METLSASRLFTSLPESLKNVMAYPPGKPIEETEREYGISGAIKLASNENALGPSPKAIEAVKDNLDKIHLYPDGGYYYLKKKLSQKHKLPSENFIIGNGTNEIIDMLIRTFVWNDESVAMAMPSFIVYKLVTLAANRRPLIVPLENHLYNLDLLASAIEKDGNCKMVFIANPNNPTGSYIPFHELERFLERTKNKLLVVLDEAYIEYVQAGDYQSAEMFFSKYPNLIVLRTFSKVYGLAGLRIGYAIAHEQVCHYVDKVRQPFNTTSIGPIAAIAALDDSQHVEKSIDNNLHEMKYLFDTLPKLGLELIPSQTNFILANFHKDISPIYEALLKRGVIVRPMKGYELSTYARITIGLPHENKRLVETIKEVRREFQW